MSLFWGDSELERSIGHLKSNGVQLYYRELELKRKDDVWDSCEKVGMDGMAHGE